MSNKKQAQRLAHQKFLAVVDLISKISTQLIKYGAICFCFYCAYKTVGQLSGRTTIANIALRIIGDLKINQWLCYAFGGGSATWALGERHLRRKTVKRLTNKTIELEKIIDSKRSSSTLPPSGTTRKEDKL